jgi:hypothetical protein
MMDFICQRDRRDERRGKRSDNESSHLTILLRDNLDRDDDSAKIAPRPRNIRDYSTRLPFRGAWST